MGYLIKLEDLRDYILEGLYGIPPCTIPPIDTLTDTAFEYSILANILLVRENHWTIQYFLSVPEILNCLAGRQFPKRKLVGNLKNSTETDCETEKFYFQFSKELFLFKRYLIINLAGNHICFGTLTDKFKRICGCHQLIRFPVRIGVGSRKLELGVGKG